MDLETLEKKLGRPFVTFLLAVVGVVLAYYALQERESHVRYEVANETNVLDVRRSLPALSVIFEGEDIQRQGLNLRLISLRVVNTGDVDILQGHFDQSEPWGLRISNGRIIEVRMSQSSSDYLLQNVSPQLLNETTVEFRKVILERGQQFLLELLVLHPRERGPVIAPLGKIAGIEAIPVERTFQQAGEPTLLERAFTGPLPTQGARLVGYALAALIGVILVGGLFAGIAFLAARITERRRQREMARLKGHSSFRDAKYFDVLASVYADGGPIALQRLRHVLTNSRTLQRHLSWVIEPRAMSDQVFLQFDDHDVIAGRHGRHAEAREAILIERRLGSHLKRLLEENGIRTDATERVDPDLVTELDDLMSALSISPEEVPGPRAVLTESF